MNKELNRKFSLTKLIFTIFNVTFLLKKLLILQTEIQILV